MRPGDPPKWGTEQRWYKDAVAVALGILALLVALVILQDTFWP